MNKTLSIALAGFSFVIEEHAYIKLSDYLSALRSSLDAAEAEEVMHDIEIRIVEILRDNMGKREVVNDEDIEKVIAQLGKPEVIEEQEEAYYSDNQSRKSKQNRKNGAEKQLFRDPENQKIGGVCAGLAAYAGMEIKWMRAIWIGAFILLIPAAGSPSLVVLLYIILWAVLPKAESAADFLKMKGKPINFDNIKEESGNLIKFANESTAKVGEMYEESKPFIKSTGKGFGDVLRILVGIVFGFIAFLFFISTFAIFGLFGNSDFPGMSKFNFLFDSNGMGTILATMATIGALIPTLLFGLLSIKLISPKTKVRNVGYVVGGLFILLIGLGTYFGVNMAQKEMIYKGQKEETENISINVTPTDSLILEKKQVSIPANFTGYDDDIYSDKKTVYTEDFPSVTVTRRTNVEQPYLIVKKYAKGYNKPLNFTVPVEVVGNRILLPNFVIYPYENRFRNYSVEYELIVPKDMKVYKSNDNIHTQGDLNANGTDDDEEADQEKTVVIEKQKININGTQIEYNSEFGDSVKINGKMFAKAKADSILKKDFKKFKNFENLKDLEKLNISIKDGDSKIEIKTEK